MIKQFIIELLATVLSFNHGPQLAYAKRHPANGNKTGFCKKSNKQGE